MLSCPICGGCCVDLGAAGNLIWLRCLNCGHTFALNPDDITLTDMDDCED